MKPRFISVRNDGLGSRLRSILNAVALAQECDGTFEFSWPNNANTGSGAALAPAEVIFSQDFIAQYYRDGWLDLFDFMRGEDAKSRQYQSHLINETQIQRIARTRKSNRVCHIAGAHDLREVLSRPAIYRQALQALDFAEDIKVAIQAAHDEDISKDATALHLRAGDIIERGYRVSGKFTQWVLPFPLAQNLAERERDMGRDVVIFGQDPEVVQHICSATGAVSAASLATAHAFNDTQLWFYETYLMARCPRIFSGGKSAFPQLASWIGDSRNENGYHLFDRETALDLTLAEVTEAASVSDLQKAFAFWAISQMYDVITIPTDHVKCLEKAVSYDPVNGLYKLALVSSLIEAGEYADASARLASLTSEETKEPSWSLGCLRQTLHELRLPDAKNTRIRVLSNLEVLLERNNPSAAACIALSSNDPERISGMLKIIAGSDWPAKAFFSYALKRRLEDAQATRAAQA